jgi:hypothetical protein
VQLANRIMPCRTGAGVALGRGQHRNSKVACSVSSQKPRVLFCVRIKRAGCGGTVCCCQMWECKGSLLFHWCEDLLFCKLTQSINCEPLPPSPSNRIAVMTSRSSAALREMMVQI